MKLTQTYTSCLHTHVRYYIYEPKIVLRIKGIIQIHHGLCEHADRYEHFAKYLSERGFVVVVSDFVGHGQSLINFEQGYFGKERGSDYLVRDMYRLFDFIRSRYLDTPYFLLGVDLGAVMIRKFMSIYGDYIEGVLLLGTSGELRNAWLKSLEIKLLKMTKGPMYRSKYFFNQFYLKSKKRFGNMKYNWLTKDERLLKDYLDDPMTHFIYTIQGYEDILTACKQVNKEEYINMIPDFLSVYIACGEDDILIHHSEELYKKYKKRGIKDLTYKTFKGCRHSLLFETERKDVYDDIVRWLNERTYI